MSHRAIAAFAKIEAGSPRLRYGDRTGENPVESRWGATSFGSPARRQPMSWQQSHRAAIGNSPVGISRLPVLCPEGPIEFDLQEPFLQVPKLQFPKQRKKQMPLERLPRLQSNAATSPLPQWSSPGNCQSLGIPKAPAAPGCAGVRKPMQRAACANPAALSEDGLSMLFQTA